MSESDLIETTIVTNLDLGPAMNDSFDPTRQSMEDWGNSHRREGGPQESHYEDRYVPRV